MDILLLGTGIAGGGDPDRTGPALILRHGRSCLMVDCGAGTLAALRRAGEVPAAIDAVFLTRVEAARLADLPGLAAAARAGSGGPAPPPSLPVYGPPGTAALIDALCAPWVPALAGAAVPVAVEMAALDMVQAGTIEIGVVPLDRPAHRAETGGPGVAASYAYTFEAGGLRLVVAGGGLGIGAPDDGVPGGEMLGIAARDADLLIHELAADPAAPAAVAGCAVQARVGALVLSPVGLTERDAQSAAIADAIGAIYRGPVVIGCDGTAIDLVARTVTCRGLVVALGLSLPL